MNWPCVATSQNEYQAAKLCKQILLTLSMMISRQIHLPTLLTLINTLRPRQNGHHFPNDTFNCIFLNEYIYISINISLKFVPKVQINNIPTLVPIMAWRRPGEKPLSESIIVSIPTHIHAVSANRILWVYAGFWWYHGILVVHLQDSVGAFGAKWLTKWLHHAKALPRRGVLRWEWSNKDVHLVTTFVFCHVSKC